MSNTAASSELLSNRSLLHLAQVAVQRWSELVIEELQKDIDKIDLLNGFEQSYLRAYWWQLVDDLLASKTDKVPTPCSSIAELEQQSKAIERAFGVSLDSKRTAPILKNDVARRLGRLKEKMAEEFASSVLGAIVAYEISSPIEQIFLMEWRFARIEDRFRLKLQPQQPLRTDSGIVYLDFCISAIDNPASRFSVAIELDGHEFHEKTVEQVREDKRRERAILRAGVPNGLVVFRFSGSEVFRDCNACIREIVEYIEQRSIH